jgi:hypothetical protein
MSSIHTNVLSNEELNYLNNHPDVLVAKARLDTMQSGMVYFSVPINNLIRDTLKSRLGLNLSIDSKIPMRWIKGDTTPHIDSGASEFDNTYLVYLNDSPGKLIIDSQCYPIQVNTGFVFNEGLSHETLHTENMPRLLLGPMNELAEPVGGSPGIFYYNDATLTPPAASGGEAVYTVGTILFGDIGNYTSWRIHPNSTGSSPQNVVYTNGDVLNSDGDQAYYYLYPAVPCLLEGSTILCQVDGVEKYVPIEHLKKGTLVKTSLSGYKPVVLVGKGTIQNPGNDERTENRLYKCSTFKYPQLKNDLYITGCHSILEFPITEKQKKDSIKHLGKLFVTDKKYRLMACVDERAEPWNSQGTYTIWHFALENIDEKMNYGVYANGGLLVETCSINFLKKKSNMTCVD